MKAKYRDIISSVLIVVGAVAMFAKLQSYNWPLLSSWKGSLAVLGVLGLGILITHLREILTEVSAAVIAEFGLWIVTATFVIASLFSKTTKAEFIISGGLIALSWLFQVGEDVWQTTHGHNVNRHHYIHAR